MGKQTFETMEDIVGGFNDYFTDIGETLQKTIKQTDEKVSDFLGAKKPYKFTLKPINEDKLLHFIKKLKPKASCGQDPINNIIIKNCFPYISQVLLHLINLSIIKGIVPSQLKTSRILPIFKEGLKNDFGNYRPISLISALGKLLEKIVASQLTRYLERNSILFKHQLSTNKFVLTYAIFSSTEFL